MSTLATTQKIEELERYGNVVPEGYHYYQKQVTPRPDLNLPMVYLKWYDIYPPDAEITPDQFAESRAFLAEAVEHLNLSKELGFVLLHRAGTMLLLLLTTWRNTNEMWEAVYLKVADSQDPFQPMHFTSDQRGTYCVWELAPIWHERHAWVRFLSSKRDPEAKLAYINDRFSGLV